MSLQRFPYCLHVSAEADSTFLSRVCGTLASLDLIPDSFHSRRVTAETDCTLAIILIEGTARQADLLQRKLQQMTQVISVECRPNCDCFSFNKFPM